MKKRTVGDYLNASHRVLKTNWGQPILAFIVYWSILMGLNFIPLFGGVASLVITGPLAYGFSNYYLRLSRNTDNNNIENLFAGFKNKKFGPTLGAYWLVLFSVIAGFVFLIIPGVFIAIRLSMVFFVLHDKKNITAVDAMGISWNIMKGHEGRFLFMCLAFCALTFLSVFTLFIGLLWLIPLFQTSVALFYEDIA